MALSSACAPSFAPAVSSSISPGSYSGAAISSVGPHSSGDPANLFFANNDVRGVLLYNWGSIDGHIVHLNVEIHLEAVAVCASRDGQEI